MNETEWRVWYRSSPLIGALGGFALATYVSAFGRVPDRYWLFRALHVGALFDVSPLLGYVALVAVGATAGWLLRRFEDRYIYPER